MKTLPLLSLLMLSACASFNSDYASLQREPVADRVLTARAGDVIADSGASRTVAAILVETDVKTGIAGENRIRAGYYIKQGEDENSEYYVAERSRSGGKVSRFPLADPVRGIQAYKNQQKLCTVTIFNLHECRDDVGFARVDRPVLDAGATGKSIVYVGRSGNILTFAHDSSARKAPSPAFDGLVNHDLAASRLVTVSGVTFEIVDTGADMLKYRIVSQSEPMA